MGQRSATGQNGTTVWKIMSVIQVRQRGGPRVNSLQLFVLDLCLMQHWIVGIGILP